MRRSVFLAFAFMIYLSMTGCGGKEPSKLEQSLWGKWNGDFDASSVYFTKEHKMYVIGFSVILEEMSWKIQEETEASKKIQVYVYDYKMTDKAKSFFSQYGKDYETKSKERYPAVFTYALSEDNSMTVYDDKGAKTEVLHKVSDSQEPAEK